MTTGQKNIRWLILHLCHVPHKGVLKTANYPSRAEVSKTALLPPSHRHCLQVSPVGSHCHLFFPSRIPSQRSIDRKRDTAKNFILKADVASAPGLPGNTEVARQAFVCWRERTFSLGAESYCQPNIFWNFTFSLEPLSSYSCTRSVPST